MVIVNMTTLSTWCGVGLTRAAISAVRASEGRDTLITGGTRCGISKAQALRVSRVVQQNTFALVRAHGIARANQALACYTIEALIALTIGCLSHIIVHTNTKARAIIRAGWFLTVCALPSGFAATEALVATFCVASNTGKARIAHADAAVHRNLIAIHARAVTSSAHPSTRAVSADRRINAAIAEATARTVAALAEGNLTTIAHPSISAEAELLVRVTCTVISAINTDARTALALTLVAPPARVTLAGAIHAATMTGAFAITVRTIKARCRATDTNAAIHRILGAIHAWNVANRSHPVVTAASALRRVKGCIAEAASIAFWGSSANRNLTADTTPTRQTVTLLRGQVTCAVARAVGSNTRAAAIGAQRSPPASARNSAVTSRAVSAGHLRAVAMTRAERITVEAGVAVITHTISAVHRNLLAVSAGQFAGRSHPSSAAVATFREWLNSNASTAVIAMWLAETIRNIAASATPAIVASTSL